MPSIRITRYVGAITDTTYLNEPMAYNEVRFARTSRRFYSDEAQMCTGFLALNRACKVVKRNQYGWSAYFAAKQWYKLV